MDDAKKCPDCEELLRLSLEYCKSLRKKYILRPRWTPEFEVWRTALESMSGKDLKGCLEWKIDQITLGWERDLNRIWKAGYSYGYLSWVNPQTDEEIFQVDAIKGRNSERLVEEKI